MEAKSIFEFCKNLGCCNACGLRFLGIRCPYNYENVKEYIDRFVDTSGETKGSIDEKSQRTYNYRAVGNIVLKESDDTSHSSHASGECTPPLKKLKTSMCVCCLGILQEDIWRESNEKIKEVLDKKQYECRNFACALSAPIATILREKAIALRLQEAYPDFDAGALVPLKEAWKWCIGSSLATLVCKALDSGAVSPLLVTVNMEYPDDLQELEVLKLLSPEYFASRNKQKKRFAVEFTRRSAEDALTNVTLASLTALKGWEDGIPAVNSRLECVSVVCCHSPTYLAGRYIKLSRELPQTPWLVQGRRMMPSSVQDIIFHPLAKACGMSEAETDHRLKFMSAGREDVDVRCLGDGRPFAIEITDPRRQLTESELNTVCEQISGGGQVIVKRLVYVTKDDLVELKKGEETKCKTYEALCIKLTLSTLSDHQNGTASPIVVTDEDIQRLNTFRNTPEGEEAAIKLTQRTPIRVLHRRPLLARDRYIISVQAHKVKEHPQLFVLQLRTSAGAYVKEAVHGELGRSRPALGTAIGAKLDILALDVAQVHLDWPKL
ncbi:hypothetical protein ACJJTC_011081 [Scirpophaga incertulas]